MVAANREDKREDYRDPPAEDPYGGMELTWEARSIGSTELRYHCFRSAERAEQQRRHKELRQSAPNEELRQSAPNEELSQADPSEEPYESIHTSELLGLHQDSSSRWRSSRQRSSRDRSTKRGLSQSAPSKMLNQLAPSLDPTQP